MSDLSTAEQSLHDGDPAAALRLLQEQVKARPADAKLRVFLFQLLAVLGQWERALNQLNVAATLDPGALAMAQMYREAIRCEVLRARVFEGKTAPMVFGAPGLSRRHPLRRARSMASRSSGSLMPIHASDLSSRA